MLIQRKYNYRLYPTAPQEKALIEVMETQRRAWNQLLGEVHDAIKSNVSPKMSRDQVVQKAKEMAKTEKEVALEEGIRWRSDVLIFLKARGWTDAGMREHLRDKLRELRKSDDRFGALTYSLLDPVVMSIVRSWSAYRAGVRNAKPPRFKKKEDFFGVSAPSVTLFKLSGDRVEVAGLKTEGERCSIRFVRHRELPSAPKSAMLLRDGTRWFVSFGVEFEIEDPKPHSGPSVGIDRGVRSLIADSSGRTVPGFSDAPSFERRKIRLERSLARKQYGSANYRKAKDKLSKHLKRRSDRRDDLLHKESARYAFSYGSVVVENLAVSRMTKSAKGTVDHPGTNVRAKTGLNRSILAQGWSRFVAYLKYKSAQKGGVVLEVDPRDSSRTCASCGHVDADNREGKHFECTQCGHTDDADVNASRVILARGLRGEVVAAKKTKKKLHSVTGKKRMTKPSTEVASSRSAGDGPSEEKSADSKPKTRKRPCKIKEQGLAEP